MLKKESWKGDFSSQMNSDDFVEKDALTSRLLDSTSDPPPPHSKGSKQLLKKE
jgi:hypothetical protein